MVGFLNTVFAAALAAAAAIQAVPAPHLEGRDEVVPGTSNADLTHQIGDAYNAPAAPAAAAAAASAAAPAAPAASDAGATPDAGTPTTTGGYWFETIKRQGAPAYGEPGYKLFRNVKDYGAVGDGQADDAAAINKAITDGGRCGQGCNSSSTTPAIIYFPSGTYAVGSSLQQIYYTSFVGDAHAHPTIKALPSFTDMAVIDADPYIVGGGGANWFVNQNNFFREIRNFVIDITAVPIDKGACIHWQVAQATTLQNITMNMAKGGGAANKQKGIFMDNGSGGFMSDLTFNGGDICAFFGNQQFTTRNLVFRDCATAITMNWNWIWNLKSIDVQDCDVGLDMSIIDEKSGNHTVGSVILQDSKISARKHAINTSYLPGKWTNGTLVMDNVDLTGSPVGIIGRDGKTVLAGGAKIDLWGQGHGYTSGSDSLTAKRDAAGFPQKMLQGPLRQVQKPKTLLDFDGKFIERSRPQYENTPVDQFVSVKSEGAKGDGKTDDTAVIQKILLEHCPKNHVVYMDNGAYLMTQTVTVPANCKVLGEMWPLIVADSKAFSDINNPRPVWQIGRPGDKGEVEITDLMFQTNGPAPGAIMMEWNVATSSRGRSGMWNTHFRIGGTRGTNLEGDRCVKQPDVKGPPKPECFGTYMLLHITRTASLLMENVWGWVADHDFDLAPNAQINIYNGRGMLIESQGPLWMYGTASEHNQLYNYQLRNAKDVYMGVIQTETPYMQSNPGVLQGGFPPQKTLGDPDFSWCKDGDTQCTKAWGLRVVNSTDAFVYGAGMYSFFENWDLTCSGDHTCQSNMFDVDSGSKNVNVFALSTLGTTSLASVDGYAQVPRAGNENIKCATAAVFKTQ